MTDLLESPIEASSGFTTYRGVALPETAPPAPLAGMILNSTLPLCDLYRWKFSNCPVPKIWADPCDPAYVPPDDKCTSRVWDTGEFRPFTFYDLEEAPCVDPLIDPQALADQTVSESSAYIITRVLQDGYGTTTDSLQSTAEDLSAAAAVDPVQGISTLLRAMATRGLGRYTIHAPIWAAPLLEAERVVTQRGGRYVAAQGVPVNFGIGFTGEGPDGSTPIADTNTEVYLYATRGAVEYNLGAPRRFVPEGTILGGSGRTNTSMAEAMREGVVAFDAGCTFAVKVCLGKVSCCA